MLAKRTRRFTALMLAAFLMLSGCASGGNDSSGADSTQSTASSPQESTEPSDNIVEELAKTEGIRYQLLVTSKDAAKEELLKGAWMYLDGTAFGEDPEEVTKNADKDAWYYGSSFWFNEDGTGLLTIGGYDSTVSYTVNDDCTVTVTHGNPETEDTFALGQHEKYGTILYSLSDENIIFYLAIF